MRFLIIITLVFISIVSCKQAVKVSHSDIIGRWNFVKAYRNGKEAKTLESAFFEFIDDKSVKSNLFPDKEMATFTLEGSMMTIQDATPIELEVMAFTQDSMQLAGKMNAYDMQFHLVRAK